jgi:hypothetical protein
MLVMKSTVFWVVILCYPVEVHRAAFLLALYLLLGLFYDPKDGGITVL